MFEVALKFIYLNNYFKNKTTMFETDQGKYRLCFVNLGRCSLT